jgi:sugar/nucleoside kinase (ribokinase family)
MFVVVGTVTMDFFVGGMEQLPRFDGDEFTTSSLAFCDRPMQAVLGGNGAISAYVLASLGAPTALIGAVGQDMLGDNMVGWLQERGVGLDGLRRITTHATASTTILMDKNLQRLAFHHPGANEQVRYADIPTELIAAAKVLLVSSYPILPGLRNDGFARILHEAHNHGAITALDIGPAIGEPAVLDQMGPLLPDVDYLIANQHELSVCTHTDSVQNGIAHLHDAGAKCVVVKRGKDGSIGCKPGTYVDVPSFKIDAQLTVGAGDSFNAGFLYGIQEGLALDAAIRFGNATAALVVSSEMGALGCPQLEDIEALMGET